MCLRHSPFTVSPFYIHPVDFYATLADYILLPVLVNDGDRSTAYLVEVTKTSHFTEIITTL